MNETPKCPYCGAEMELKYVCGEYFCLCAACEATSPTRTSKEAAVASALHRAEPDESFQPLSKALRGKENATLEEMLEAVEQLKHRTEPENRPLTLEEIWEKVYDKDWNFLWLEYNLSHYPLQIIPRYMSKTYFYFLIPGVDEEERKETIVEINKSWRCWPRKPTPEQIQDAKWEE